jgi:indolepyruvate ferredoxin oxidoreductase
VHGAPERCSTRASNPSTTLPPGRAYIPPLNVPCLASSARAARLHTAGAFRTNARALFAGRPRLAYQLHPPLLRGVGLRKKLQLGEWFTPVLRILARLRRLRGTPLDPFGRAHVRRVERELIPWYRDAVMHALARLEPANAALVAEIANAPESIRGYEEIKLRSVAATRERVKAMLERLGS